MSASAVGTLPADLLLVDASIYIFRAWHSIEPDFFDDEGFPVNAVWGFCGFLCTLIEQQPNARIALAFDESLNRSFRNEIYPDYKANREPAPVALKRQFAHCRAFAEAIGLACFSDDRYEADDLVGTLAVRAREGARVHVISADKDLTQLIRQSGDTWWDFARARRLDATAIEQKFGVRPDQIADYLALVGDKVDNIPGVTGIGPKSAAQLLTHFGSIDELLQRRSEIAYLSMRGAKTIGQRISDHCDQLKLMRQLTTISTTAELPEPLPSLLRQTADLTCVDSLFDQLNFGQLLRRRVAALPTTT